MQIYHRTTFVWHTIRECVRVYAAWNGTTIHQNIFLTSIQVVNAITLFIRRSHWINFYRMNPPIEQEVHSTGNIPKSNSSFRSPRMSTIFFCSTPFSIILVHIGSLHGPGIFTYHEMNRVNNTTQKPANQKSVSQPDFVFCTRKEWKSKKFYWKKSIAKLME